MQKAAARHKCWASSASRSCSNPAFRRALSGARIHQLLSAQRPCIFNRKAHFSSDRQISGFAGKLGTASAASTDVMTTAAEAVPSFQHGLTYTCYECNSFGLRFNNSGVNLLVDPWLVDDLVFFGQDGVFRGKKRILQRQKIDIDAIAAETDLILITQYWPDHFHEPTLKRLPRHIPLVGSPKAAVQAKQLGFTNVVGLPHDKSVSMLGGKLYIRATAGAEVGPLWVPRENGFVIKEATQGDKGLTVYYEPHCDFAESSLEQLGHVDVVVSPVNSEVLGFNPMGYPLVEGDINLGRLAQLLTPKVILATFPGSIDKTGLLQPVVYERGTLEDARRKLKKLGLDTRIETPGPSGEAVAIAV